MGVKAAPPPAGETAAAAVERNKAVAAEQKKAARKRCQGFGTWVTPEGGQPYMRWLRPGDQGVPLPSNTPASRATHCQNRAHPTHTAGARGRPR